jgi:hypothetical protein
MKKTVEQLLLNRVNRKLVIGQSGSRVHLCRYDSKWFNELGRCYETDERNLIVSKHVDLEDYAKDVGATAPAIAQTT